MWRTVPVIKREFTEGVRTRMFILGTLFGPVLMLLLLAAPALLSEAGAGGMTRIAILDATEEHIGQAVAAELTAMSAPAARDGSRPVFRVEVYEAAEGAAPVPAGIRGRVEAGGLDGFLVLPPGLLERGSAVYEGTNATAQRITRDIDRAVTEVVRGQRMERAGIPGEQLAYVMAPVPVEKRTLGTGRDAGAAELAIGLGYIMAIAIYMAVMIYGATVGRGILEEKRDRIVEVILSSIDARAFMTGKVLGIGATGLLQMGIWALFAALLLTQADAIGAMAGIDVPALPSVPGVVAFNFLFFFVMGFFLYGALFAAAGAIATGDQELQQLQFPVMIPLIFGFLLLLPVIENPNSGVVVAGTLIPFTAPMVVPMRSAVVHIPTWQWVTSIALLAGTVALMIWIAAGIYGVGVLATGKRPRLTELARWLRTS